MSDRDRPVAYAPLVRLRRFYWRRLRRWDSEICGSCCGGPAEAVIRRYGCGRPVAVVWHADSSFWNRMVTGRPLPAGRTEGAGGILCLSCFDGLCRDRGETRLWVAEDLGAPSLEVAPAVRHYLQVDGSGGTFDALEMAVARRRLVDLVGEPEPWTLQDCVAAYEARAAREVPDGQ